MAVFLALTSRGLVDTLYDELTELGFEKLGKSHAGVSFESNWQGCYRANLLLRSATKVVLPILDFQAYQTEDLYAHVFKKHDFTKYIGVNQTLAVDAKARTSNVFRDQRFVALKVKDAIVDQFREKFGERPNVDAENPDLRVMVRVVKSEVSMAIDTSGESLAFRGYREMSVEAPLREHLAAALVRLSGWKRDIPIVDLMAGSGTILIEAALMARNTPAGALRKRFGFEKLLGFQREAWDTVVKNALDEEVTELPFKFYGFDKNSQAVNAAKVNAARAGVEDVIEFRRSAVDLVTRPCETGVVIVNPPYAERLGQPEVVKDIYRDLAYTLKKEFKGWTCWLLSGNEELTSALKLKAQRKIPIHNGPIECRFLEYQIR